jgi:hypothetical protein
MRRHGNINELLEAWARWCHLGGAVVGSGSSMLARMIDNQGLMNFGASGGQSTGADSLEASIEATVLVMANSDQLKADVLRLEYGAGWHSVIKRRRIRGYDARNSGQDEKSKALGVSVRTYRRRLSEARALVMQMLGG